MTKKKWPLVEFRLYTKYKTGIEICKADLTKVNFYIVRSALQIADSNFDFLCFRVW